MEENIGTNTGVIRDSIKDLEVILADGSKIENMSYMKKNNTGYDIKNIFCGSESTLGIITKALIKYIQSQKIIFIVL